MLAHNAECFNENFDRQRFLEPLRSTDSLNRLFVSDYLLSALPLLSQLFCSLSLSFSLNFIFSLLSVDVMPKTVAQRKRGRWGGREGGRGRRNSRVKESLS